MYHRWKIIFSLFGLIFAMLLSSPVAQAQKPEDAIIAIVAVTSTEITWQPQVSHNGFSLVISGPNDFYQTTDFRSDQTPSFKLTDDDGTPRTEGAYHYELVAHPILDPQIQALMAGVSEETRYQVEAQLRAAGKLPAAQVQTGQFLLTADTVLLGATDASSNDADEADPVTRDQQIQDDLIVNFSACVGNDCVNGENFGFDTIRLKENNLRLHFDDTSNSASFPSNDWRLVANDSSNGGSSYLAIEDSTAGRQVFRVDAGAPANALRVDNAGDVGIGTANPVVNAHVVDGNTPTVRLEQNGSSGFTAQTWDMGGNEANFFIRDVSNGSRLSFRIRPGAPESSIDIAADGDIGLGTSNPGAALHLRRTNDTAHILVEEANSSESDRVLMKLQNNGVVKAEYNNTGANQADWQMSFGPSLKFKVDETDSGSFETVFLLFPNGNLTLDGNLTELSDVNAKENFIELDSSDVLARLANMPIHSWNYKDDSKVKHIGPTAQDFYAAFGLGQDERHIAPLDTNGIALVAIQALNKMISDQDKRITNLEEKNAELEMRLNALEKQVDTLLQQASKKDK